MRWLAFVGLAFGVACRPSARHAPSDGDAARDGESPERAAAETARTPRFSRPVAAARAGGAVAVVGRDRATRELALAKIDDAAPGVVTAAALPAGLDEPELVGSARGFGLLARAAGESGEGRVLYRLGLAQDAGAGARLAVGAASCATEDGVYSLARDAAGWTGSFFSLDDVTADPVTLALPGRSEATVVCGQHRAFVVLSPPGELRAIAWSKTEHGARPTALPRPTTTGDEDTAMAAMDDELAIVKLERSVVHTLVWTGSGNVAWRKAEPIAREGLALEAVEADKGKIGVLLVRTIAKVKGCPAGETTDAALEVALVDAATGKLVRAPESLETWKCGAEPGPFFAGWAGGKLVVAWPRGADAACVRAGVKRGGIGYAEVDPASGRARAGRVGRPAETIAPAGCDGTKCYAVALTRGAEPCGAVDAPDAGRLEVIAYPP
jgi:hypothetical protein